VLSKRQLGPRFRGRLALVVVGLMLFVGPWLYVHVATAGSVVEAGEALELAEAALVFGTLVNEDGTLSPRLAERVEVAVALYFDGTVPELVMSGTSESDTGQDETARMRDYAVSLGVPAEAITLDPLGLGTFATCDRAANVYGFHRVIVVTNEYHVARATWLCQRAGLSVQGVHAPATPSGWTVRGNAREVLAAWKAMLDVASR
jgi:vancomycin permeability regulator SanA